ncbi:MAG: HlyD family efflux transporter periplasmic adaptor subunit [Chloroflexi bacterium]|nr:HlyD family efflux transporter periplasmic adaptor subunit [Chloroflexota bacterium]
MNSKLSIKLLAFLFVALLPLAACDQIGGNGDAEGITAAGVVEATQVTVAPALSGRATEIFVFEGDTVTTGDPLFRLEDEALTAQHDQAVAALGAAEAGLDTAEAAVVTVAASMSLADAAVDAAEAAVAVADAAVDAANAALESALAGVEIAAVQYQAELAAARAEAQPARAASWEEDLSDEFSTPPWYFQSEETLAAAEAEVEAALSSLETERAHYDTVMSDDRFADFHAAETRLAEAQAAFLVAEDLRDRKIATTNDAEIDDYVQSLYDSALAELEAAQLNYDQLLSSNAASDVLETRGRLAAATERYEIALDRVTGLMTGEESFGVQAAGAGLRLAETAVFQAEAGIAQAEAMANAARTAVTAAESSKGQIEASVAQAETAVTQAEKMVDQAQAAVDLMDIQMERLVVTAAVDGTIMTRNLELGEIVRPGMSAMSIGQLDDLTVTVYIPENKYGQISLGDQAQLTADSFPDETFDTVVIRIADQAEFTPRNVQTKEERQTTVYAVELSVTDPDGKLKPGMPADVEFGE